MSTEPVRFLMGQEEECLTLCDPPDALPKFIECYARMAPSLPDVSGCGCFNPYGRVYLDAGPHVELATAEADSPEMLVRLVNRQHKLAAEAVRKLAASGVRLVLANNNHSGLLTAGAPSWGAHSNHLVTVPPEQLAERLLPFLCTCPFGGSGGVVYPTGEFVCSVRSRFVRSEISASTTDDRALVNTRSEHLATAGYFRLHLILFDGLRSQFGLALKFATTALALQAVQSEPGLAAALPRARTPAQRRFWVEAMRQFHHLADPGQLPTADAVALDVQQLYLDGARRWSDTQTNLPLWVPRSLDDWQTALDALRQRNHAWLARRLDPWIKFDVYTAFLDDRHANWPQLPGNRDLFSELALLDQQYHEFCNPDSPFDQLDRAGLLDHRIVRDDAATASDEILFCNCCTRAAARARFLAERASSFHLRMDWCHVTDVRTLRVWRLDEPFAAKYFSSRP